MSRKCSLFGFSYVEMVFVIAILATLAAVATPYLQKTIQRQKELALRQSLREIRTAIDAYKAAYDAGKIVNSLDDSGYPKSLDVLVEGVEDVTDIKKRKLRFLRRIPIDPMYDKVAAAQTAAMAVTPDDTWGKRSYDSPADDPRPGKDVYDVYSLSSGVGLNGVPYAQW